MGGFVDGVVWTVKDEASLYCGSTTDAKRSKNVLAAHLKMRPELFSSGRSLMCDSGSGKTKHRLVLFQGLLCPTPTGVGGRELGTVTGLVCAICGAFSVLLRLRVPLSDLKTF
jgi:hypothetical protein